MNGNTSTTAKAERLSDTPRLMQQWKTIDWKRAEDEVNRLQIRIAKATQEKKWNTVKRLQYLLTHSYYAKALAVRKVTTNKGKNTSGVDKELWSTPASKMRAVLLLTDKGYKSKPLRRVYIEKKASVRYPDHVRQGDAGALCAGARPCFRGNSRHKILWFPQGAMLPRCVRVYFYCTVEKLLR